MKTALNILLSVLASVGIVFVGFILIIMIALNGTNTFYINLFIVGAVIIWLFIIINIWELLKPKIRYISLGSAVVVMILSTVVFEINKAYNNSFEEMNDQGVDLSLYEPFRENTLAVSLNEPPTLKISDNLPRIDGATALYPLYSAFVRAVYPEDYYESSIVDAEVKIEPGDIRTKVVDNIVACTNTDGAYRRLVTGDTDIIFTAGPSKEQLQMAKDENVEFHFTPIGREAFVFFVNSKNTVDNLSINDIKKIYSGESKNWKEFRGKSTKIRAFQRPENSGSQTALIKFLGDTTLMTPPEEDIISLMGGIINRVSTYKNYDNAIGYSFLFFATEMVHDNKIKLLSLNGVAPTRENVANQTYPYAAEFYAVTTGQTNPNSEAFIKWILSPQGQYIIEKTGYTPLNGTY